MSPKTCGPLDPKARLRRGPPPTLGKGGTLPDLSLPIGLPPALARVAAARAADTHVGTVSGRVTKEEMRHRKSMQKRSLMSSFRPGEHATWMNNSVPR